MKIKNKLLIGFGLLFLVVVFFGIVAVYYIEDISEYSKVTVKNNYETLKFTRQMRSVADENDLPLTPEATGTFNDALKKQENNITEPGEKQATADLRKSFSSLIDASVSLSNKQQAVKDIRLELKTIDGLNMKAIEDKNNYIHSTVSTATLYLGSIVFVTFLILFIFVVNFPGFILNPLHEFIDGVRAIRQKNYDARLEFKTGDEFAELAVEFNAMAENLAKLENKDLTKILSGENQVKTLIEELHDAVIGVNEKQEILFINTAAKKILKSGEKSFTGQPMHTVIKNNDLLKAFSLNSNAKQSLAIAVDGAVHQYQLKSLEIVVPNLKSEPFGTLQFSGFPAGMIYILKNMGLKDPDGVKSK